MTEVLLKVNTTGGAGVSAGTAITQLPVTGFVESISVDYAGTAPATTDVTVTEVGGQSRTLLSRANTATNGVFYPRPLAQDTSGTNLTGEYTRMYLAGAHIQVAVAQSNDLSPAVTVRVNISED